VSASWIAAAAVVVAAIAIRALGRTGTHRMVRTRFRAERRHRFPPALSIRAGRADAHAVAALPLVLDDVARGLRSGGSLRQACDDAAARAPATLGLGPVLGQAARGVPLADALAAWPRERPLPEVRVAAAALALAADAGGPQARAIDSAADTVRERLAVTAEVRAQSGQARLSALVIGCLPVAFLAWAVVTDRRTAAVLVGSPAGWACLAAGAALEAAGAIWMGRIVRGATS
jgi:tight adherence protein B